MISRVPARTASLAFPLLHHGYRDKRSVCSRAPRKMTPGDKSGSPEVHRVPLRADRGLLHEEGACLPLRSRHGQCRACAEACPTGALTVDISAVSLSEGCIDCGRCTAACPTQALALPELLALADPPPMGTAVADATAAPVRVECRMVPSELLDAATVVVPCTGALTTGRLLAHAAAGRSVHVIDRGWCAGCEAGCSDRAPAHPAAAAVAAAAAWLGELAAPATVSLQREPLPLHLRPASLPPAPPPAAPIDRRRFFRAALEKPAGRDRPAATPMGGDGRAAYPADERHPSPERERQHDALSRLAAAQGQPVPAEFFPTLHADAKCCDRRMCIALCPTAALTAADDGTSAHLQFDPLRCIGCGTCERACPEGALALTPHGGTPAVQTLAVHRRLRCGDCGDAFTVSVDAEGTAPSVCPTCTKARRFIADARRQLFGAMN
ncbi:4Fe-4S binding protein [Calidifontimicrobium sp. SYSU G02091]|uniref:4Fe-4S dicluster domain-containing protein n=1 Tax=Calidifontimicrobium sp. SYSU G02091 TaxID=2926421 RepID=UPI001F53831E|nr:4Fe-4S dicluster domain-containing protein [Calidifontimicrobium sp. SYSU G02091]MCI1193496.1 4Fe-4S binding protein [Calidifontimicrobium sp. SYSU G02091]